MIVCVNVRVEELAWVDRGAWVLQKRRRCGAQPGAQLISSANNEGAKAVLLLRSLARRSVWARVCFPARKRRAPSAPLPPPTPDAGNPPYIKTAPFPRPVHLDSNHAIRTPRLNYSQESSSGRLMESGGQEPSCPKARERFWLSQILLHPRAALVTSKHTTSPPLASTPRPPAVPCLRLLPHALRFGPCPLTSTSGRQTHSPAL